MKFVYLLAAVIAETIGTSALQASNQFSRLGPSIIVIIAYAVAFYLLARTLAYFPVGIAYALWSGLGIVLIALIGYVKFGQTLDLPAVAGMALILGGIVIINLFSKAGH